MIQPINLCSSNATSTMAFWQNINKHTIQITIRMLWKLNHSTGLKTIADPCWLGRVKTQVKHALRMVSIQPSRYAINDETDPSVCIWGQLSNEEPIPEELYWYCGKLSSTYSVRNSTRLKSGLGMFQCFCARPLSPWWDARERHQNYLPMGRSVTLFLVRVKPFPLESVHSNGLPRRNGWRLNERADKVGNEWKDRTKNRKKLLVMMENRHNSIQQPLSFAIFVNRCHGHSNDPSL